MNVLDRIVRVGSRDPPHPGCIRSAETKGAIELGRRARVCRFLTARAELVPLPTNLDGKIHSRLDSKDAPHLANFEAAQQVPAPASC